jgi:hypothetical protein
MDRGGDVASLIADLERCLAHADELGLALAAAFICHAIEKLRAELHATKADGIASTPKVRTP